MAHNKELIASSNLILQISIHYDYNKVGIPLEQVGGLPTQNDCQMNDCFLPEPQVGGCEPFYSKVTYWLLDHGISLCVSRP